MLKIGIAVMIGGAIGAILGSSRSCDTGACPLTSNPYIGGAYGAIMGFLLVSMLSSSGLAESTKPAASEPSEAAITEISTSDALREVIRQSTVPVLVDFWAPWCAPCRKQLPELEKVASQMGSRVHIVKVNVDEAPAVAREFRVSSLPTLVMFKGGNEDSRYVGFQSASTLVKAIESPA